MSSDMSALVGTIIGGLISLITSFGVAHYSNLQAEAKRIREKKSFIKIAARMVRGELIKSKMALHTALAESRFPFAAFCKTDCWINYQAELAETLSEQEWNCLLVAYAMIEVSLTPVANNTAGNPTPNQLNAYQQAIDMSEKALHALQNYIKKNDRT